MSNTYEDLVTMIGKIIKDMTRFYVPRLGYVSKINDSLNRGRILVHIASLGWDTDDKGAWCFPKDKQALITPNVGDYVLVEFLDGDRDFPVYSGIATQMKDMLPTSYESEKSQVIFENRDKDFSVLYKEDTKQYLIDEGQSDSTIEIGSADESFIKGDTAKTELQKNIDALTQLQTDFTSWTPVAMDGGAALKAIISAGFGLSPLASLANILSEKIKGE